MARYHVCMVLVGKLPVPATLGGAVEALAQHLLEQNERDPQIEFTVLTVDEPKAQALAAGFEKIIMTGDLTRRPPKETEDRWIVRCRRPLN